MTQERLASLNLPLSSLRFFCCLCIFLQCHAETLNAQEVDESAGNRRTMVVHMRTESGDPIQEAEVRFVGRIAENRINQTIQANADGRVTLEFEEGQVDSLWFTAQGNGRVPIHYVWRSDHSEIKLPEKIEIELVSGSTMEGQVVDEQGLPIENATINLHMPITWPKLDSYVFTLAELVTDAEGKWSFSGAPKNVGEVSVSVSHVDYLDGRGYSKRLVLKQGPSVTGLVLDSNGNPIAGARARIGPDRFGTDEPTGTTDEEGRFKLKNCKEGATVVTIEADGYAPALQNTEVTIGEMEELRFELEAGHKLRARIVDVDGNPVAGVTFVTDTWRGYRTLEFRTTTAENGLVEWNSSPPDSVLCDILKAGYMAARKTRVSAGDAIQEVTLYPELVISGRVIDKVAKKPVHNFKLIRGQIQSNLRAPYWRTDEHHAFEAGKFQFKFDEPMEGWLLQVQAEGYKPATSRVFRSDEGQVRHTFLLEPASLLEGRVIDADGNPVPQAQVVLATAEKGASFRNGQLLERESVAKPVLTDEEGKFAATLPEENYWLVVVHDAGFAEVASADLAEQPTVQLQPWARVKGKSSTAAVPDAQVELDLFCKRPEDGRSYRVVEYSYRTRSDAAGEFEFDRVIPGECVVSKILIVENGQYTTHIPGWQQTFEVEPGKVTEVNLGGTGSRVSGSFVLDRNPPSSLKWKFAPYVDLQKLPREWPYAKYAGRVTENGSFVIEDVPDGEYEVDFEVQAIGETNQIAGTLGRLRDKVVVNSKQSTDGEQGQVSLDNLTITLDDTLEVGEVIPRFVAETLEGTFLRDRDLTGKLVLINFWSSYSDASANETATMAKLSEELEGESRVLLLSFSTEEQMKAAKELIEENGWQNTSKNWLHVYAGPRNAELCKSFALKTSSTNFVVGPDGTVLAKNIDMLKAADLLNSLQEQVDFEQRPSRPVRYPLTKFDTTETSIDQKLALVVLRHRKLEPDQETVNQHQQQQQSETNSELLAFDETGEQLWRVPELQSYSGQGHTLTLDRERDVIYVAESAASRLSAFDHAGRRVWQIENIKCNSLALDEKTGNIWVSGGDYLSHGTTVVFTPQGDELFDLPYRAIDMAYNPNSETFWLVGYERRTLSRDGSLTFSAPVAGWCYAAISVNPANGDVWLTERDHPDVAGSANRHLLLNARGDIKQQIDVPSDPSTIAALPSGAAIFSGYGTGMWAATPDGKAKQLGADRLLYLSRTSTGDQVWAITEDELLHINGTGISKRIKLPGTFSATIAAF